MDEQQRTGRYWVVVRAAYARWPGGRHMLVRMMIDGVRGDTLILFDGEGRRHDLRAYRLGMFDGRRRCRRGRTELPMRP